MNRDYILNYANSINEALDADISVTVEEAVLRRYALYAGALYMEQGVLLGRVVWRIGYRVLLMLVSRRHDCTWRNDPSAVCFVHQPKG